MLIHHNLEFAFDEHLYCSSKREAMFNKSLSLDCPNPDALYLNEVNGLCAYRFTFPKFDNYHDLCAVFFIFLTYINKPADGFVDFCFFVDDVDCPLYGITSFFSREKSRDGKELIDITGPKLHKLFDFVKKYKLMSGLAEQEFTNEVFKEVEDFIHEFRHNGIHWNYDLYTRVLKEDYLDKITGDDLEQDEVNHPYPLSFYYGFDFFSISDSIVPFNRQLNKITYILDQYGIQYEIEDKLYIEDNSYIDIKKYQLYHLTRHEEIEHRALGSWDCDVTCAKRIFIERFRSLYDMLVAYYAFSNFKSINDDGRWTTFLVYDNDSGQEAFGYYGVVRKDGSFGKPKVANIDDKSQKTLINYVRKYDFLLADTNISD